MRKFKPDLIIEVTAVCNRSCAGCYAPNAVSKDSAASLYAERPELFLSATNLQNALTKLETSSTLTTIRGGEPSIHPELSNLIKIASENSAVLMIETHGRWLLPDAVNGYRELIAVIREFSVFVKISFDKMHGLGKEDLHKITEFLEWNEIEYRIAITESSETEFLETRKKCSWISDDFIIHQTKAKTHTDLIIPVLGVVNVEGTFNKSLTSKFDSSSSLVGEPVYP